MIDNNQLYTNNSKISYTTLCSNDDMRQMKLELYKIRSTGD